jgi:glycosyltransferase involved in cell wall biosynthesis
VVRLDFLSRHLPAPQGTAAGRLLMATVDGLLAEGADVTVTSWAPEEPADLPAWCRWAPLPPEPVLATRARAVVAPRADVRRLGWQPQGIAVADDPLSAAALPRGGIATLHYATAIDVPWPTPKDVQDIRAELRLRRSSRVLAYSDRVAAWVRGTAVPAAVAIPAEPLALVEQPVAALVADWRWAPNRKALEHLLRAWREVDVPGARLLLAGRGGTSVDARGVQWLGEVADVHEVLEQAAVLAFPCPDTSGPKVKVLEAAAAGLPVLTTASGAEGFRGPGLQLSGLGGFGRALGQLLRDPERRAERAATARATAVDGHGPRPAARARMQATQRLTGHQQHDQQGPEPA